MEKQDILISIIMPTLNSERTIEKALKSIRNQSVDKEKIEILVVDGGSTDKTKELAIKYDARIIHNRKVVPEAAKHIGITESRGKYIVFMDSDEEFSSNLQLENRLKLFENNLQVKSILPKSINIPNDYPAISRYVNAFGDPFSYFVYGMDTENIIDSLNKKKYRYEEDEDSIIYHVNENDVLPIGDGGTVMFDLDYIRENFREELKTTEFVASIFVQVVGKTKCMGIIKDDAIFHYSSSSFKAHLKKLKFRIKTNLAPKDNYAGFTARAVMNKKLQHRKYMFIIYGALIPWVLFDSINLSINKKDSIFMTHFLFTYYVFFQLIYQSILIMLGKKIEIKKYGE